MCRKLLTLCHYESFAEADFDKLKLSMQGIETLLLEERAHGLVSPIPGNESIKLLVPEAEYKRAAEALHIHLKNETEASALNCAFCASANVRIVYPKMGLLDWVKAILNLVIMRQTYPAASFYCRDCGNRFHGEPGKLSRD